MNMLRSVCAAAALILLGACASNADAPSGTELIEDGRDIAIAECAQCHAVGGYGESPHAGAPPFRTLFSRYRAEVLEEELIAGIQVAHPDRLSALDSDHRRMSIQRSRSTLSTR